MRNNLLIFVVLTALLTGGCTQARFTSSGTAPTPIRPGVTQLFIDDELIAEQSGLKRTLHQPKKDNGGNEPMIAAKPDTTLLGYGSIVFDTKLQRYVMFCQEFRSRQMLRTTSADGLNWDCRTHDELQKVEVDLKLPDVPPELRKRSGLDLFSCYYDTTDAVHPYKAWLWLANCGNALEGIHYYRSTDGLKWERGPQVVNGFADNGDPSCIRMDLPDRTLYGPGDVTLFSYDPLEKRFLGIFKFYDPRANISNGSRSRAYLFLDRIDRPVDTKQIKRIDLLPPLREANGDQPFDEYYASTAWRYGSLWLGGLKIFHGKGDYPWSPAGGAFLKLVVSRDGLHWKKVQFANEDGVPEVFIPNGREGGNEGHNDGGYISEFSQGPLRVGDELIYYYGCSSYGKNHPPERHVRGGGIFRARLRLDGFVSVDAGTLTTRPLATRGSTLTINGIGPIQVELLDADGKLLGSATVSGDSLRHAVTFDGRSLGDLAGRKPVRLRFTVTGSGSLYSFTIS